jgi:hypothetical protein
MKAWRAGIRTAVVLVAAGAAACGGGNSLLGPDAEEDGTVPDGAVPDGRAETPPDGMDGGRPDFSFDAEPEAEMDVGDECNNWTCREACRAAGYDFGMCNPSGACVCY